MKKGYWVVSYRAISDETALEAYAALAVPAVQSFGGRFLTSSKSEVQARESGLAMRTVVTEFESYEKALAARESEAYQKALAGPRPRGGTRFQNRRGRKKNINAFFRPLKEISRSCL